MDLELAEMPGDAARVPLVFLHEGLGSLSAWRDFPARVAQASGRRAIVYSRAGYGRSPQLSRPRPLTFMHDEARVALPALLDTLGIERVILVGHSDGASIALIQAAEPNTRVRALVLEAPHVLVEDVCVAAIARLRDGYDRSGLRERLARHHADPDATFAGWAGVWLDPEFRRWDLRPLLPRVRAPLLAIQGADDQYGTVLQLDELARAVAGPCERLLLPACGHAPHRDRPDETLAAMVRFLATQP